MTTAAKPIALLLACSSAIAQMPPDAGTLQREAERALERQLPANRPNAPLERPMSDGAKAVRVSVKSFSVEGATLIPAAELEGLLEDLRGQSLTLAELESAAQRVARYYRQRGWYVRVYLPVQDVTAGHLRLQVVEGRYGGVRREQLGQRTDGVYVESVVTQGLKNGEPLPANVLERGLLLANDLAGVRATGILEAGEVPGTSRLLLKIDDLPFLSADLGVSNQGVKSTGEWQLVGGVGLNNLSGRGDRLSLRTLAAENLSSLTLQYSSPLGGDGWALGLSTSVLDYRLGERFSSLKAQGSATTAGATLNYAWVRQADRNLRFSLGHEQRQYADDAMSAPLRRQNVEAWSYGINGDIRDALWGGGSSWGALQLISGRLRIGDIGGERSADASGPRSAGSYDKVTLQWNRLQSLGNTGWLLQFGINGQWADRNLASSERFSLGGPGGVRAYPVNEGSGDEGLLAKLELQRELTFGWRGQLFYDYGRVRQHKREWSGWQGGSAQPNQYHLEGAGIGVSWAGAGDWRFSATYAAPIGSNAGAGSKGENSDGSASGNPRLWLSLSAVF